jgi:hypothetical protein
MNLLQELMLLSEEVEEHDFEVIYHGSPAATHDRCALSIAKLLNGKRDGEIYNVDYGTAKETINRAAEKRLSGLDKDLSREVRHWLYEKHNYSAYVMMHETTKPIRGIKAGIASECDNIATSKDMKTLHEILEVLNAMAKCFQLMKELKSKVVKGRKPRAEDPNTFRNRLGSAEAQKAVREHLLAGIKEPLDDFEERLKEYFDDMIAGLEKQESVTVGHREHGSMKIMVLQRCFEFDHHRGKDGATIYTNLKKNAKGETYAKDESSQARKDIEAHFISKNVLKLSQIVDKKGNLQAIAELPSKPAHVVNGLGTVEAGFKFDFTDGSQFTVINKAVCKRSFTGKYFYQFPTTFHSVRLADGTMMKQASEEKMVKEFAKEPEAGDEVK